MHSARQIPSTQLRTAFCKCGRVPIDGQASPRAPPVPKHESHETTIAAMHAGNAAVPAQLAAAAADLENGGGAATVDARPYPADLRLMEKQPFTWLRAAPYLALMLAGAALFAGGVLLACTAAPDAGPTIYCTGAVLAVLGITAAAAAYDEGRCECNLRRFGLDD